MPYEGVPGLVESREAYGETTLVVDPARLEEACLYLRDEESFNLLVDVVATDYLGWGEEGVAGYYGSNAGRDLNGFDIGAWVVTVVAEDSAAAKKAARILVAFYISSMPPEQLERHGITMEEVQPVVEALGAGDVPKAIELFRPELSEKLSVAGTPEECVEKIKADIEPAGVNHMILALSDPHLVKFFTNEDVENVPDITGQLKLVAERVMPAFN